MLSYSTTVRLKIMLNYHDWLNKPGALGKESHGYAKRCFFINISNIDSSIASGLGCNHVSWFGTATRFSD